MDVDDAVEGFFPFLASCRNESRPKGSTVAGAESGKMSLFPFSKRTGPVRGSAEASSVPLNPFSGMNFSVSTSLAILAPTSAASQSSVPSRPCFGL